MDFDKIARLFLQPGKIEFVKKTGQIFFVPDITDNGERQDSLFSPSILEIKIHRITIYWPVYVSKRFTGTTWRYTEKIPRLYIVSSSIYHVAGVTGMHICDIVVDKYMLW
jgi:hypothetical protein